MLKFNTAHPHDSYFKVYFTHVDRAQALLSRYVPADLMALCDLSQLSLVSSEFTAGNLQTRSADLVYRTTFMHQPTSYIYFLIEHQSRPDPTMMQRLVSYMTEIARAHQRQFPDQRFPVIYPLVIYNGLQRYTQEIRLTDAFSHPDFFKTWLSAPVCLVDLGQLKDEEILTHGALAVFEHLQKNYTKQSFEQLIANFAQLTRHDALPLDIEESSWHYMFTMAPEETDFNELYRLVTQHVNDQKEQIMSLAQRLHRTGYQEGMQTGRQEGIQTGRQEGREGSQQMIVTNMLAAGCTAEFIAQVTGLSAADIDRFSK